MVGRKLAIPLLGVLMWVMSIHGGTFDDDIYAIYNLKPKDLNESLDFANDIVQKMKRLETNLGWANIRVAKGTPQHGQVIVSEPDIDALSLGKEALIVSKATSMLLNRFCRRLKVPEETCVKTLQEYSLNQTPFNNICHRVNKVCSKEETHSKYRTYDGSCNHYTDGDIGEANTVYKRLLNPVYLDGIQAPKRAKDKSAMPSARLVSSSIIGNLDTLDKSRTLVLGLWSQFIEFDLSHTAMSKMVHFDHPIECCNKQGNGLSPRYMHPLCFQIEIPMEDENYSKHDLSCMTYVRSVIGPRSDCSFGPNEQINQATHYLDASQLYGTSYKRASYLRTLENGKLETIQYNNRQYMRLSNNPTDDCQVSANDSVCFLSGDSRVNLNPQLSVLNTIWVREHNRIAEELAEVNPNWDDEALFQEARRIVVAEIQHITYNEWMPEVLGKRFSSRVNNGYRTFNEMSDPTISNAFATAALRAFNSLLDEHIFLIDENRSVKSILNMHNYFNKPDVILKAGYFDDFLRGLATQLSQKMDTNLAEDVTNQLYSNGKWGYDVLSLDIQRGRDHGLPSYTAYREYCGLSPITHFGDLLKVMSPETAKTLSQVYTDPEDIDLIIGGLAENPEGASLLGPTLSCIVAEQLVRTKHADRFFFSNPNQPAPFTRSQLQNLQKVTLARIFCDNSDNMKAIQPNVFRKIGKGNNPVDCNNFDEIPSLDFELWGNRNFI